jgi:hypothetical protein
MQTYGKKMYKKPEQYEADVEHQRRTVGNVYGPKITRLGKPKNALAAVAAAVIGSITGKKVEKPEPQPEVPELPPMANPEEVGGPEGPTFEETVAAHVARVESQLGDGYSVGDLEAAIKATPDLTESLAHAELVRTAGSRKSALRILIPALEAQPTMPVELVQALRNQLDS